SESYIILVWKFFFLRADGGIRDFHVTGVQTCALPISSGELRVVEGDGEVVGEGTLLRYLVEVEEGLPGDPADFAAAVEHVLSDRSEERRGGKECRRRWAT